MPSELCLTNVQMLSDEMFVHYTCKLWLETRILLYGNYSGLACVQELTHGIGVTHQDEHASKILPGIPLVGPKRSLPVYG